MDIILIIIVIISVMMFSLLLIFGYIMHRKQEIEAEKAYNNFLIAKRKLRKASSKKNDNESEDDELDDFLESVPAWLQAAAEGANIDLEKVFYGDETELSKVKTILDKNIKPNTADNGIGGGLIG